MGWIEEELRERRLRTIGENIRIPEYKQQLPDARKHQIISFIKSGIRILGYVLLPFDIVAATVVLVISEVVGILEELV